MNAVATTRETVIEQAALDAARAWASAFFVELVRDGRAVEGGWPGTIREARAHAAAGAGRALSHRSLPALTHNELDRASRVAYDEAHRSWFARARGSSRTARSSVSRSR